MSKLYALDKAVLGVSGNSEKFLNGITSNTLDKPRNAFLAVHGKIIATFDQVKAGDDKFLIVIEHGALQGLLTHLDKFIRLSKAVVQKEDNRVYFDLTESYRGEKGECLIPQKKGQLIITKKDLLSNVSDEEFTLFRLQNNIPVHGVDYKDDLLLNVDEYEFVSYTKGCFLGQELIAKVHNRSKPSWKLVVKFEADGDEGQRQKMTSRIQDPQTKKTMGFVFVPNE
ncbi:MAG: hypothetical protein WC676_00730 [Candidatus Omnitrophota bacterium]